MKVPEGTRALVTLLPEDDAGFWLAASEPSLGEIWGNAEEYWAAASALIPRHGIHFAKNLCNPLNVVLGKLWFKQGGDVGFEMFDVAGSG